MSHRRIALSLFVALALALVAGCAEEQSPSDHGIAAHASGWMDPESADFHAASVAARGVDGCRSCHGADLEGFDRAGSCVECHAHPTEWLAPASDDFHGDAAFDPDGSSCQACHGEGLDGGWSGVSCYNLCHDGPGGHPEGWISPVSGDFHGDALREAESADGCRSCHGSELDGGAAEVSCYEPCHDGPGGHPFDWLVPGDPQFHGAEVSSNGTSDCESCHGASLDGGWAQVGCNTGCHAAASGHDDDWMNEESAGFHGDFVETNGAGSCETCHGSDYLGGWSGVSCFNACHDGPSGHPYGWTDLNAGAFHGAFVIAQEGVDLCVTCHGADLDSGWAPTGCYEACHDGPGGHPSGWASPSSADFHEDAVYAAGSTERCQLCHGADYGGGWSENGCFEVCHSGSSPHPGSWLFEGSGQFHGTVVAAESAEECRVCHGRELLGDWAPTNCYFHCHDGPGGHPSDWNDPEGDRFHGDRVEDEGVESCRTCHGEDLAGGWSEIACSDCHEGW